MIPRSPEAEAFQSAVEAADPAAVSACAGWRTHEVVAHVAGIAVEVVRHLEPYLASDEVPTTRGFEEREAPLRALPYADLLARLEHEDARMRTLVGDVLDREADAVVPWTGRRMAVASFVPHLRNEHALHRWDVVGDDETSRTLLGQRDLVEHSVGELGRILLAARSGHDPEPGHDFDVRLRSDGQRDLRVVVEHGSARLEWADDRTEEAGLASDAAARHLLVWGRRPGDRGRLRSTLPPADLALLQALLSGY